jgi:hypothetical protein
VIRPQAASGVANRKAPLAPKQGLGGALANVRGQHQSPISGTYALRTPRGKITSIACESCRKRKSKVRGYSRRAGSNWLTSNPVRWSKTQMQHLPIQKPYMYVRRSRGWQNDNSTAGSCTAIGEGAGRYEINCVAAGSGTRPSIGSKLGIGTREKRFRASFR